MKRLALAFMLAACGALPLSPPPSIQANAATAPTSATAPSTTPSAPPASASCPAEDDTVEGLRRTLNCERMWSADLLNRLARATLDFKGKVDALESPPSRVKWLLTGVVAAGIGCYLAPRER